MMARQADCKDCEELLQPYVDRTLTEEERAVVQAHLAACQRCARCYHLEAVLWKRVRDCCDEETASELATNGLKQRLSDLRARPPGA
ncbi:MAG: anti-sigma factor family protein [Gaiellales bacterium]